MMIATVTALGPPIMVRESVDATPLPARVMARADAYAPAVNDRVLVEVVSGQLYVIGEA